MCFIFWENPVWSSYTFNLQITRILQNSCFLIYLIMSEESLFCLPVVNKTNTNYSRHHWKYLDCHGSQQIPIHGTLVVKSKKDIKRKQNTYLSMFTSLEINLLKLYLFNVAVAYDSICNTCAQFKPNQTMLFFYLK